MKYASIIMILLMGLNVDGQSYRLVVDQDQYEDLENSISLNGEWTWDDSTFTIPLGFDFQFFDQVINELFIDEAYMFGDTNLVSGISGLIAYGADIIDRGYDINAFMSTKGSLSPISYVEEGRAGARILKVEWNNVGFYSELADDNVSTDYTNIQLWLYEGSNIIEIRLGPTSVTQPMLSYDEYPGPMVGLFDKFMFNNGMVSYSEYMVLEGDPNMPVLVDLDTTREGGFLDGTIPNGTVYRFIKNTTSTSQHISDQMVEIHPNPSLGLVTLKKQEGVVFNEVSVLSSNGMLISSTTQDANNLNLSGLAPGIYYLKLKVEAGVIMKKIIIN